MDADSDDNVNEVLDDSTWDHKHWEALYDFVLKETMKCHLS